MLAAAQVLESCGAHLIDITVPDAEASHQQTMFTMAVADMADFHHDRMTQHPDRIGPEVLRRLRLGLDVTGEQYAHALRWLVRWKGALRRLFDDVDLVLTPTTPDDRTTAGRRGGHGAGDPDPGPPVRRAGGGGPADLERAPAALTDAACRRDAPGRHLVRRADRPARRRRLSGADRVPPCSPSTGAPTAGGLAAGSPCPAAAGPGPSAGAVPDCTAYTILPYARGPIRWLHFLHCLWASIPWQPDTAFFKAFGCRALCRKAAQPLFHPLYRTLAQRVGPTREYVAAMTPAATMNSLTLTGALTLRGADELRATLRDALLQQSGLVIDCNDAIETDLTFVQLLLAAHVSATAAQREVALRMPPAGAFAETLTRAGFVPVSRQSSEGSAVFWFESARA